MDLSIIIVNWNSSSDLQKCLGSIYRRVSGIEFEVIVIDNASYDGCDNMLRDQFPGVHFIQSERNLGFARANNVAFDMSTGRNILFLNPDTEVEGSAVVRLSQTLDSIQRAGIVGAKLLNSDRSVQTSCVRVFPTILNQLLDSDALRRVFPEAKFWGTRVLFVAREPTDVDAVSGACLAIKRSVFEGVERFSDDYFMYSEDIDLCLKVKAAGWRTLVVPDAIVVHHGGTSTDKSPVSKFSSVMQLESRWRFFRKTRSMPYCFTYRLAMCCSSIVRIVSALLAWPIYAVLGRTDRLAEVIKKWTPRLRWALGGESWVRTT